MVKRGRETLVAACDCELLGKNLKFGKIEFLVRKDFYEGEILSVDDVLKTIRTGTTVNLLGESVVGHALKAGLVHPDSVLHVSGIPHAMIVKF